MSIGDAAPEEVGDEDREEEENVFGGLEE